MQFWVCVTQNCIQRMHILYLVYILNIATFNFHREISDCVRLHKSHHAKAPSAPHYSSYHFALALKTSLYCVEDHNTHVGAALAFITIMAKFKKATSCATRRELYINALGMKTAHLPGNNMYQDWSQFVITNNHTVFGIFCHDKLHPLRYDVRIVALFGSLAMALAIYNIIYLYFQAVTNDTVVSTSIAGISRAVENVTGKEVASESIVISLIGTPFLTFFDYAFIWYIAAVPCCLPGNICGKYRKFRWVGLVAVIAIVLVTTILSIWAVVANSRHKTVQGAANVTLEATFTSGGLMDDMIDFDVALASALSGETDPGDWIWGAFMQWLFVMLFARIVGSSVIFFFRRHYRDYDKFELKWNSLPDEDFSDYDGSVKEHGLFHIDESDYSDEEDLV